MTFTLLSRKPPKTSEPTFWFPTRSDTNQAVQLQKMARGLKFRIYKVEGLYYLCSGNKGADQLRGHREADLHLCFRICKNDAAHIYELPRVDEARYIISDKLAWQV